MYRESNEDTGTQSVRKILLDGGRSGTLEFALTDVAPGKFTGVVKGDRMNLPEEGVSVNCYYYGGE